MTSKVQTITAQIYDMAIEDSAHVQIVALTDALIAASHAEGVAEEREKLVHCKQCVFGLPDGNPAHDYVRTCIEAAGHKRIVDANDYCMFAELGNAPVLAPTKEGEKSYYGGQSATSSGDHWEQKLIHGPEMTGKP